MTMTHPVGEHIGVTKSTVWYGPEAEGLLGRDRRPTAFIDKAPDTEEDLIRLEQKVKHRSVTHVFLTENFVDWEWFERDLFPQLENVAITIACYPEQVAGRLTLPFIWRCGLMVRANMQAPWMRLLRPRDQVTVGIPYDLVTWVVEDGFKSEPRDYMDDRKA